MSHTRLNRLAGALLAGFLLAACGGNPGSPPAKSDTVATRVAQELAVAATLTALAPAIPPAPTQPSPEATPTRLEVIIEPVPSQPPATPTGLVTTVAPPPAPPTKVPSPQPTRVLVAVLPVDGSDGNKDIGNSRDVNEGRNILLPGLAQYEVSQPMVFRDRIVFQVEVFDGTAGHDDGAGIESVTFSITDETGQEVHRRVEKTPGYCVFGGGEPTCTVWRFSEHGGKWPGGAPVHPGVHDAQIVIQPKSVEPVTWFWSFRVEK